MKKIDKNLSQDQQCQANPDPITDEPSSHPAGTGFGGLAGAVAGSAIGAIGGPPGMLAGGVLGAVAGALGGHRASEAIRPSYGYLLDFEVYGVPRSLEMFLSTEGESARRSELDESALYEQIKKGQENRIGKIKALWLADDTHVAYVGIAMTNEDAAIRIIPADLMAVSVAEEHGVISIGRECLAQAPACQSNDVIGAETELAVLKYYSQIPPMLSVEPLDTDDGRSTASRFIWSHDSDEGLKPLHGYDRPQSDAIDLAPELAMYQPLRYASVGEISPVPTEIYGPYLSARKTESKPQQEND